MKIIMIYDQIQSGLGTKDDTMVPLTGKKEPIGPAVMMEPFLNKVDGHVRQGGMRHQRYHKGKGICSHVC